MPELSHIEGLKELDALLKALPEEIAKHDTNLAVSAGAQVIRDEMRLRAPVAKPSDLSAKRMSWIGWAKTHIRSKIASNKELAEAQEIMGARVSTAALAGVSPRGFEFYLRFIEYGHNISHNRHHHRRGAVEGHVPARPFLRPAFESSKDRAFDAMAKKLWDGIQKSAAKLTKDYYHSGFSKSGTLTRLLGLR